MAETGKKFIIEIYRKKDAEELTAALADPEGKLEIGSAAALTAADACAMALRALARSSGLDAERTDYLRRNLEKLRSYMVYLIDEDVKGRNLLRRAVKEGVPERIEAACEPGGAISNEIVCQCCNLLDLLDELSAVCTRESAAYLGSAVRMAMAALHSARLCVLELFGASSDETTRFVVRRENEITLEHYGPVAERILSRVEDALQAKV